MTICLMTICLMTICLMTTCICLMTICLMTSLAIRKPDEIIFQNILVYNKIIENRLDIDIVIYANF